MSHSKKSPLLLLRSKQYKKGRGREAESVAAITSLGEQDTPYALLTKRQYSNFTGPSMLFGWRKMPGGELLARLCIIPQFT
jgi:hypothetical protein